MLTIKVGFDFQTDTLRAAFCLAWNRAVGLKLTGLWFKKNDPFSSRETRLAMPFQATRVMYNGKETALIYDQNNGSYTDHTGAFCAFPDGVFARRQRADGDRDMALLP